MSVRASRWWIAAFFVIAVPWPMPGPFDAFVPAIRYAMLALAGGAVGLAEGATGPVPMLLGLLTAQALVTLALCAAAAWGLARLLSKVDPRMRAAVVLLPSAAWLLVALTTQVYRTPLGDHGRASLLEVIFA